MTRKTTKSFINKSVKSISTGNVRLLKKLVNLKSNKHYLELEFQSSPNKKFSEVFLRNDIYCNSSTLVNYGVDMSQIKNIVKHLSNEENKLGVTYQNDCLGWSNINGDLNFQSFTAFPTQSEYCGNFDIKPKGTYKAWKEAVISYAMPQIPLQLAIVLGLSAVTTGFLKEELDGSIFAHLYGSSSKGKTTFAMLSVSTAGNPNPLSTNTLMGDWSDTPNFRIGMLANNYGFPVVFDELSTANKRDISEFCYNVANSKEKGRMNSNAERKDVPTWLTTVVSTGENSLLAQCSQNGGLLVRVLELSLDTITESAEQAEALKTAIVNNYGFANTKLAEYILTNSESIKELFDKWRQKLEDDIKIKNSLMPRLSKKLAVVMLTAEIARVVLGLDFDLEAIEEILLDSLAKQNERKPFDMSEKLTQYLIDDMVSNPQHYQEYTNSCSQPDFPQRNRTAIVKKALKKVSTFNVSKEVIYIPFKFEELLQKGGFTDLNLCLDELKKAEILITDKVHKKVKRTIDGKSIRAYVLHFPSTLLK